MDHQTPIITEQLQVLIDSIGANLLERQETIAVAESVTGGFTQFALSTAENAIHFYQGGITAYNLAQKYHHLMVEPIHAQKVNCVSGQVARQMALGVCKMFGSDWGIAISGYASPVPESNHEVFAVYAITYQGAILAANRKEIQGNDSKRNQIAFTAFLLNDLLEALHKN